MEAKGNDPDARSADDPMLTMRDLNTRKPQKLMDALQTAWLAPEIELIQELDGPDVEKELLELPHHPDPHDERTQDKWVKRVRLKHENHRELVDVAQLKPGVEPAGRPIHPPRDMVAGFSDLAGASTDTLKV